MSKIPLLLQRIQRFEESPRAPPKTSKKLLALLNRLNTREWLPIVEGQLMEAIVHLKCEVKFIEHLPRCRFCQLELQLDVERYNGVHSTWYLSLENSEYLEEEYPDCPKEEDYTIDDYWSQVERYRQTGTTESKDVNTLKFILDRAKWAYQIAGKQIKLARQLLRLVRNWNFSEKTEVEFNRLFEELEMYEIANPSLFSALGCKHERQTSETDTHHQHKTVC
ncbi:MAG: hypothetical protein ABSF24_06725 [Candidatus Bathyarchaeia archaeon]|jgi:hypothetical protein